MDFLASIPDVLVRYGPPTLFVLTVVVFVHELGHFLVARLAGVDVKVFSIGFGPELLHWTDRRGTRWRVAAVPLGGYVKFAGDENAASQPDFDAVAGMSPEERRRSFLGKGVGWRAAIVAAGPIANFLLAIAVFAAVFTVYGRPSAAPKVGSVVPESAAAVAGIRPGDVIRFVEGTEIKVFADVQDAVYARAGEALTVTVERDGRLVDLTVTPRLIEEKTRFGVHRTARLGIRGSDAPGDQIIEKLSVPESLVAGVEQTWMVASRTLGYLGRVLIGRESTDQLSGPLRVAQISGEVAGLGILALFNLLAFLSVSIGLLNLLPIPMLDGGHLLFYAYEAVRGRPLSARAQDLGFRIGLGIVLALFLVSTWNDIWHLLSLWRDRLG